MVKTKIDKCAICKETKEVGDISGIASLMRYPGELINWNICDDCFTMLKDYKNLKSIDGKLAFCLKI